MKRGYYLTYLQRSGGSIDPERWRPPARNALFYSFALYFSLAPLYLRSYPLSPPLLSLTSFSSSIFVCHSLNVLFPSFFSSVSFNIFISCFYQLQAFVYCLYFILAISNLSVLIASWNFCFQFPFSFFSYLILLSPSFVYFIHLLHSLFFSPHLSLLFPPLLSPLSFRFEGTTVRLVYRGKYIIYRRIISYVWHDERDGSPRMNSHFYTTVTDLR